MHDGDRRLSTMSSAVVLGVLIVWAPVLVWLLLGGGCIRVLPPSDPVKVEVVRSPMPAVPYCELPGVPIPPPELRLDMKVEDVVDRTMVHLRDHNQLITWGVYMVFWAERAAECLGRLTNRPSVSGGKSSPGAP